MSGEDSRADGGHRDSQDVTPSWRTHRELILLVAILLIASVTRMFQLGQTSLWYDEVVTMRLARTEGPAALLEALDGDRCDTGALAPDLAARLGGDLWPVGRLRSRLQLRLRHRHGCARVLGWAPGV